MKSFSLFLSGFLLLGISFSAISDDELFSKILGIRGNPPIWKVTNTLIPGFSFNNANQSYSSARIFVNEMLSGVPVSRGSGFFIGPNLFVTNLHVISKILSLRFLDEHFMRVPSSFRWKFTKLEREGHSLHIKRIVRVSLALDLVLLEITGTGGSYFDLEKATLEPSEDVWAYGYPGKFGIAKLKTIRKKGDVIRFQGGGIGFLTDYHRSLVGGSGGPLVDHQGKIRGVLYSGISNFVIAITGQDLSDFVEGNIGVDCTFNNLRKCVEKDREQLFQSAKEGDVFSQRRLGFLLYRANKRQEAQTWLERAARQNDPIAQYIMGTIDRKGRQLHWFSQAIKHEGFTPAKYELADYLLKIRQRERAIKLYWESAHSGYRPSIKKLNRLGFEIQLTDPLSRFQLALASKRNRCYSFFRGRP